LTNFQWYPEVQHFCPYTPLVLVGLKSDLRNKKTCVDLLKTQGLTPVTTEQGRAVAKKMNAAYMECSSKEMIGVHELFEGSIITIIEHDAGYAEEMKQQSGGGRQSKSKSPEGGPIIKKKKKRNCAFL
jgi:GTPase SAR1 family protein